METCELDWEIPLSLDINGMAMDSMLNKYAPVCGAASAFCLGLRPRLCDAGGGAASGLRNKSHDVSKYMIHS